MLLVNDLHFSIETWDDPGDYPSGAGGGPLPSYQYPVCEGAAYFDSDPSSKELDALVPDGFQVPEFYVDDPSQSSRDFWRVTVAKCYLSKEECRNFSESPCDHLRD